MKKLTRTTSENPHFQELIVHLDRLLKIADGDWSEFFSQYNKTDNINHVVIYYDGDKAIGCGAFKEYQWGTAEIKRMYVIPEYRGKGIAGLILEELELWAKSLEYDECILETSINLNSAIALYIRSGYRPTKNYGQYKDIENSLCFSKFLK
jgi:putative acetyltransferase